MTPRRKTNVRIEKTAGRVIGAGNAATQLHLPYLFGHPDVRVAGVASANGKNLDEWVEEMRAKGYGGLPAWGDWSDPLTLIRSAYVDAVIIASPNDTHFGYVMAALEAGKHVLCEKLCGLSSKEAEELAEEALLRPNQVVQVNYIFRFLDGTRKMHEMIRSGQIGTVQEVTFTSVTNSANSTAFQPSSWRNDNKRGGGVWADMGSHCIDLAVHLFDGVVFCHAELTGKDGLPVGVGEVDYDAKAVFRVGGRSIAVNIWVSQCYSGDEPENNRTMVVRGTNGSLVLSLTRGN